MLPIYAVCAEGYRIGYLISNEGIFHALKPTIANVDVMVRRSVTATPERKRKSSLEAVKSVKCLVEMFLTCKDQVDWRPQFTPGKNEDGDYVAHKSK